MKILSAAQTQKADAYTIENEPIAGIDLMERAARKLYDWFHENIPNATEIIIFCGKGNNGGDGLALSRMLLLAGWKVKTVIINHSENASSDFKTNLERLQEIKSEIHEISSLSELTEISQNAVVVDAILGSGLNQKLHGLIAEVVAHLNSLYNYTLSIDIPTGLFAEPKKENDLAKVINADLTLTFQTPFLSFMFPETGSLVGQFEVLNIGLSRGFIESETCQYHFVTLQEVESVFIPKEKFAYKGSNGHALIIGGSKGKMGAVALSSKACLKSGAGLVTAGVPESGISILQQTLPEVMASNFFEIEIDPKKTYAFGPGLGTSETAATKLHELLELIESPVVLDADAINILSASKRWDLVPQKSILTPHLGELARIVGKQESGFKYLKEAKKFADEHGLIVLIKGPHTAIVSPDKETWFNSTGNQGMATAGSGDVLTGMITSFLAQGYECKEAAILGVYFQGLAGDFAAIENGVSGLIATDIINHIPSAIKSFEA